MNLGAFSVSLTVKDIKSSKAFYEKLGFSETMGAAEENWLIMKNGDIVIGLFHGMFEKNILTFNPGWDKDANKLGKFMDIRQMKEQFKAAGIDIVDESEEQTEGPANFTIKDPDGNQILFDQHV